MGQIYYWNGFNNKDLCEKYKENLQALLTGEYSKGANVKKLKNYNIYRLKLNDKGRVLFSFYSQGDTLNILVLQFLEEHEYSASPFLNKGRKRFLEHNRPPIEGGIKEEEFEACEKLPIDAQEANKLTFTPVHNNQGTYIVFDEAQNKVLSAKTPLIIEGPPGSGKTSLAFTLILQGVAKGISVLYVTQSEFLAEKLRNAWEDCPEYEAGKAKILSYKTLLEEMHQEDFIDFSESEALFKSWFSDYLQQPGNKKGALFTLADVGSIYQEFRTLTGYSKETYTSEKGVGQKQCLFKKLEERIWLYKAFESWKEHIKNKKLKLCEFYEFFPKAEQQVELLIVDEAQDFSHLMLRNAVRLAFLSNCIFCLDPRQNLTDENPKSIFLNNLLSNTDKNIKVEIVRLSTHYRCPALVMEFACVFNKFRLQLAPPNKAEPNISQSQNPGGIVRWVNPEDTAALELLKEMRDDVRVCVITQEQFVAHAKKTLGIVQVFTSEEAKGLEFSIVILLNMLEGKTLQEANKLLAENPGSKILDAEPKYSVALSRCFVAATRATNSLYMVQAMRHETRYISSELLAVVRKSKEFSEKIIPEATVSSKAEDWEAQAKILLRNGNQRQAHDILREKLNKNEAEIKSWVSEVMGVIPSESKSRTSGTTVALNQRSTGESTAKKELAGSSMVPASSSLARSSRTNTPSISQRNVQSNTKRFNEFFVAITGGKIKVVKKLIDMGIDVNDLGYPPGTPFKIHPLHIALQKGFLDIVKVLVAAPGININATAFQKEVTALQFCIQFDQLKIFRFLISKCASVNATDNEKSNTLHHAAAAGKLEFVTALLETCEKEGGILLDAQNSNGYTALHLAILQSHLQAVNREALLSICKALVQANARVDVLDNKGNNVLLYACSMKNVDIIYCLLEHNINDFEILIKNLDAKKIEALLKLMSSMIKIVTDESKQKSFADFIEFSRKMTAAITIINDSNIIIPNVEQPPLTSSHSNESGVTVPPPLTFAWKSQQDDTDYSKLIPYKHISDEVKAELAEMGLKYQEVPNDNHCLYHAVALYIGGEQQQLRNQVADYVKEHRDDFPQIVGDFEAYIEGIKAHEWADSIEINILMRILNRPIIVIGKERKIKNTDDISVEGEPIFVYYNGHTHYDVLINVSEKTGEELLEKLTIPRVQGVRSGN